ncbi:MAG: hypothetical protein IH595_06315 [Bacteroidales bacterium]|nr:hypothetical protein [Bacteroidales bacterium]
MDGFSYYNIFQTKGIEYLAIIAFLIMLIPFWVVLNKPVKITVQLQKIMGVLSANVLRIPQGLFYSKNHAWTYLEKSGRAKVGLDDLLLKIVGPVKIACVRNEGEVIKKGDLLAEVDQQGKSLKIYSPISGMILDANPMLTENPDILNEDPYGKGWIYDIKPTEWIGETKSYFVAKEATSWFTKELERLKDFLAVSMKRNAVEPSLVVLQEGGELRMHPLSELQNDIWQDFQNEFLNQT